MICQILHLLLLLGAFDKVLQVEVTGAVVCRSLGRIVRGFLNEALDVFGTGVGS